MCLEKYCRTKSLSAHSFAIAIDINVSQSDYWRSYNKEKTDQSSFGTASLLEIVHIFEKHGWIWGGRWYHYDTMHFEYRPEIVAAVKLKSKKG
ncbi:MAG: M15 family metallopeptidase [Ignavibacteriales bacterium]|nr:M15 family metallopeptidase [Ignavibacteriales bacterium]